MNTITSEKKKFNHSKDAQYNNINISAHVDNNDGRSLASMNALKSNRQTVSQERTFN